MSKNKRRTPLPEPEIEPEEEFLQEESPENDTPQEEDLQESEEQASSKLSDRLKNIVSALPSQKTRRMAGFLCLFAGLFFALAFISHFFYWYKDFDKIQLFLTDGVLRNTNTETLKNLGGSFGAMVAFRFINLGFGIAALLFPLLLLMGGLQLLNLKKYAWIKVIFRSLFALLWISILIGWFCGRGKFYMLGGYAGIFASSYLRGLIGNPGLGFLLLFTLICYLILNYNLRKVHISFRKPKVSEPDFSAEEPKPAAISKPSTVWSHVEEKADDVSATMTLSTRIRIPDSAPADVPPPTPVPAPAPEEIQARPLSLEDKSEDEPEDSEPATAAEMSVVDTRVIEQKKPAHIEPRPDHFGIDTPFDPRLELSTFRFPGLDLLEDFGDQSQKLQDMNDELLANKNRIVETLQNYGIGISKISATIGPTVTLYEIVPAKGIRISKIKNLEDDIALSLSALGIRIIAPIPGKGTIGIEVPNSKKQVVPMRDMLTCEKFRNKDLALPIALGKTISNEEFVADLAKMPHLLVAGATGQGKSVGLNAIVASLLYSKHPAELKFVMVDPKKVELSLYSKIERHYLAKLPDSEEAIITDTRKVVRTLNSLCKEMDNRYDLLKDAGAKNLKEYNKKIIDRKLPTIGKAVDSAGENRHRFLPYIVLIIDEFADLIMTAGREVELPIARLAQLARAIGIHLVIATQRPSVNIITGMIKANFPGRIAFKVSQKIDSRTILDAGGADQLIGRGDMLISMGDGLVRLQCPFIDTPEIERITDFIGTQPPYPDAYLLPDCPDENGGEGKSDIDAGEWDSMFREAAELVVSTQQGSSSMLQRKFKLGYNRAARIMDQLENAGIVGAFDGRKIREVKIKDPAALESLLSTILGDKNNL